MTPTIETLLARIAVLEKALEATQPDTDSGFAGDTPNAAEWLWASLPTTRKWTSLKTYEKAMVCHAVLRLRTDRKAVLEEAAKVVDNYARTQREAGAMGSFDAADIAEHIAQAIRALKGGGA